MEEESIKALQRTESEQKAINYYQGDSTNINELLDNFISPKTLEMCKAQYGGVDFPFYTRERLTEIMTHIENLYSAMVKEGMRNSFFVGTLYRGSSQEMSEGNNHGFISTTQNKNEALLFSTHNADYYKEKNHCLTYLHVSNSETYIPHLTMGRKGNEEEILFSPFVNLKTTKREYGTWSGYDLSIKYMDMTEGFPRELSNDEMKRLEKEVLEDVDQISNTITDFITQKNKVRDGIELDKETAERVDAEGKIISEWKSKFRLLMEGRCREVQKKIEREVEEEKKNNKDVVEQDNEPLVDSEMKKESDGNMVQHENALTIKSKIHETKTRIENKMKHIMNDFKRTGISYESPAERINNITKSWNFADNLASAGAVQQVNTIMNKVMNVVDMSEEQLNKVEENEFKRELAMRVMRIRAKQEMAILTEEQGKIDKEKIGLWGKVTGKQKEKDEKMSELGEKRERLNVFWEKLNSSGLSHEQTYSVHEILAEMSVANSIGVPAQEKDELVKIEEAISGVFKVKEQKVTAIVDEKSRSMSREDRSDIFIRNNEGKISNHPIGYRLNIEKILGDVSNAMNRVKALELKNRERGIERDTDEWRR